MAQSPQCDQSMMFHHVASQKLKAIGITVMTCLLISCSDDHLANDLNDYGAKLQRVLDQTLPEGSEVNRPLLPTKRDLQHKLTPLNIDLLDFFELGRCELQQVIAQRNSSLGKFAADSTLLAQDVRFIQLTSDCLTQLDQDSELTSTLEAAVEQKQQELDQRLWNALFAGPEYREFWHANLDRYPEQIDSRVEFALQSILTVVGDIQAGRDADLDAFETSLEVLRNGEAGALLESWRLVEQHLDRASELLRNRFERRPLCFKGMSNPDADIFRNVVLQDFIAGIQKNVAILNRRYYDVVLPLRQLEQRFENEETAAYRTFRLARDERLHAARQSVEDHVAALRPLMVQCGFLPAAREHD